MTSTAATPNQQTPDQQTPDQQTPDQQTPDQQTPDQQTPDRAGLAVGTLLAACLAACLAQTALAIPATLNGLFQSDLHPVGSQLTWISDAFLLPVAVLELTFGVLGDLFGRKQLLIGGALLILVGELVASLAGGVHQLWVGQAIAGLGAAALFPTSLAMVASGVHTHRDRVRVISIWAAALSTGGFIAPVVGGITGNAGSWRTAFAAVVVFAAVSVGTSLALAQDSSAPEGRSLDWPGQITIAVSLLALLYGVIEGPGRGWSSPRILGAFVLSALCLALFVLVETRSTAPLLRLELFRSRPFAIASVVAVVGMFSFLGTAYATSIRLGPIQHQSPLRTSVAFVILSGITLVQAPVTLRLLQRVDSRRVLAGGLLLMAVGDLWAARIPVENLSLLALAGPLVLVGIGFALSVTAITHLAVESVPMSLTGMASGATSLLRDVGFTLGPAVIGAIALSRAAADFTGALGGSALPPAVRGAAAAVARAGGPLAVNSVPPASPPGQAHALALHALGSGYSLGYVVCGVAALVAGLLTLATGRGQTDDVADAPVQEGVPAVS